LNIEGATPKLNFQADALNRDWTFISDSEQNFRLKRANETYDTITIMMTGGHANFAGDITSNSQAVIKNNDARLTNQRTPTDNSVDNSKVADGALSQSKINGLETALAGKQGTSALGFTVAGISSPIQTSPNIKFNVDGTTRWQFINDTSNSNTFSLQRNTGLGMGDVVTINSNGKTTLQNGVECASDVTVQSNLICNNNLTINNLFLTPNQPTAFLRFIGTQSVANGVTAKVIPDGIIYNVGNMWNAGQGRFNISVNALYLITASMTLNNRSSTTRVLCSIRRNNNAIVYNEGFWSCQVSTTQILTNGDYLELFVSHSGASPANIITTAETHFSLTLIG